MNYYIQGDAANADKIKAAFENKGFKFLTGSPSADKCNYHYTFMTKKGFHHHHNDNLVYCLPRGEWEAQVILNHPDYKELELPVEPKFKVGDWIVYEDGNTFAGGSRSVQVKAVEDDRYIFTHNTNGSVRFIDRNCHLWSIADAKDGDVLVTTKIRSCPFIYRKTDYNNNLAYYYAGIDGNGDFCEGCLKRTLCHFGSVSDVIPATKEQRDLLFQKMKEAGYEWDAEKKELRKIKPHYNISNFYAGMPVLVRDYDNTQWRYVQFSHCVGKDNPIMFNACGNTWEQCIPFEGNEHLLGATDMCDEMYINW